MRAQHRYNSGTPAGTLLAVQANRQHAQAHSPSPASPRPHPGIAWDEARRRLFVTGKYWPRVFEVVPKLIDPNNTAMISRARRAAESCLTA